jgi:acyl-CoA synthetase (AMP-forming)/AMP-acid ligase II
VCELVELFARVQRDDPDRVVLPAVSPARARTAGEVWADAAEVAAALARAGVGAGSLVTVSTGNDPSTCAAWLACRMRDAAVMPLDRASTALERAEISTTFRPTVSLVRLTDSDRGEVAGGLRLVPADVEGQPDDGYAGAAVLKLTSGSSGRPKATFTTEAQALADARHIIEGMGIAPDDVQMGAIPLSHSYGIGNLVLPLLMQGTALVLRNSFFPQQVADDARMFGARVMCGVPFMFEHFVTHPPPAGWPPTLRWLISAGAPLDTRTQMQFARAFDVKIHSFYGTSETGGISFDATDAHATEATVGTSLPGVRVTLRPVESGSDQGGRVHVESAAVSTGYAQAGVATEAFRGGFLTEDLGRFTADGQLVLIGRMSGFINVAGRKVQPDEVERILRAMPGIADALVVGVGDRERGEQLVACVVPEGTPPSLVGVRRHCAQWLAPHKVPRRLVMLDTLPRTVRGKPDRAKLRRMAAGLLPSAGSIDVT